MILVEPLNKINDQPLLTSHPSPPQKKRKSWLNHRDYNIIHSYNHNNNCEIRFKVKTKRLDNRNEY
jgi:hypothetical protein